MNRDEAEQMLVQLQSGQSRSALGGQTQLQNIDARLEDVIRWCRRHSDPTSIGGCLRPARILPPPLPESRWQAVETVIAARRQELRRTTDYTLGDVAGRLLVYFPDVTLPDGRAETASSEFFDVHHAPPCGTWVGYFEEDGRDASRSAYLLAWIPQLFVPFANEGLRATPDARLAWLLDTDVALQHAIELARFGRLCRQWDARMAEAGP
jgi:hypothetical protein